LLAGSAISASIGFSYPDKGFHSWSLGTAYAAFVFLAAALAVGPINTIRRKPNPVHTPLRRDIGIAGGLFSVAHTLIGLQVHLHGELARYFLPIPMVNPSTGLFQWANWIGLVSVVILAVLVAISNNLALRRLGLSTWKFVQRWAYPAVALAVLHGIAYQLIEKRSYPIMALLVLVSLVVIGLQFEGVMIRRRSR
jgi:sulfoxide reductase heme-binding subunit YedZ